MQSKIWIAQIEYRTSCTKRIEMEQSVAIAYDSTWDTQKLKHTLLRSFKFLSDLLHSYAFGRIVASEKFDIHSDLFICTFVLLVSTFNFILLDTPFCII